MGASACHSQKSPPPEESVHGRLSFSLGVSLPQKKSFSSYIQGRFAKKVKSAHERMEENSSPNETTLNLEGSPSMKKIQSQNSKGTSPDFKIVVTQTHPAPKYQMGQNIGKGPHGTVNEALRMESGEQVALKKVCCKQEHVDTIRFYLQKKLLDIDHLNLVNYIEVEDLGNNELNIVSELISGSSLESVLDQFGKLKEGVCKLFIGQILKGLDYLHKKGSYHGNLKPRNVFIDKNGNVKLGDFFIISRKMLVDGPPRNKPICYLSPEYIKDQTKSSKTDVWALGCLLIEMLTKEKPWKSNCSKLKYIKEALSNGKTPEIPKNASEFCKGFFRKTLTIKEEDRASIEELMKHPFLEIRAEEEKNIDKGFKKMVSFNQDVQGHKKKSFGKSKTNQQMLFVKLKTGMGKTKELPDKPEPDPIVENNINANTSEFSGGVISNKNNLPESPRNGINKSNYGLKKMGTNKLLNRMTTAEIRKRNEEERRKFEEELLRSLE